MTAKIVEQCIGCGSTRQVHVDGVTSSVKCSGIRTAGGTKHEIYGSGSRILRGYWKRIFAFLEEPQVGKDGSGK